MPVSKLQLLQDRALRDAARQVVTTDLALMRADLEHGGLANRAAETGADYLKLLGEGATEIASEHRGKLAGGISLALAGIAAWLFRKEIGEILSGFFDNDDEYDEEPVTPANITGEAIPIKAEHE